MTTNTRKDATVRGTKRHIGHTPADRRKEKQNDNKDMNKGYKWMQKNNQKDIKLWEARNNYKETKLTTNRRQKGLQ